MQVLANSNHQENPDLWNSEATKFVHKVNELLRHHNGSGVQEFKVQFPLTSAHAPDIDRWVLFAVTSGAKSLKLLLSLRDAQAMVAIQHVEPYNFPLKHFTDVVGCKLNRLNQSNCSLETVHAKLSGFSYLGCLKLDSVSMVDAVVLNMMSSCSTLRVMGLRKCHQLINLRACHPQLLCMEVYDCKSLTSISIHAEKLKDFSYKGHKVPRVLQKGERFVGLKEIVLCLLTSWKERIRSVAYLLKAAPVVETFKLEVYGKLQPLSKLKVEWPKKCTLRKLHTVKFGGFSGEAELLQLLFFLLRRSPKLKDLLIDPRPCHYEGFGLWKREKSEDATRCYYARGVALKCLPSKIPSTVKFSVM